MGCNRIRNTFLAVAVLVMIGTAVLLRGYGIQVNRTDDAEQVAGVGLGVVQEVQAACAAEAIEDDTVSAIREAGLCKSADDAAKDIEESPASVTPAPGPAGERGPSGFGINGTDGIDGVDGMDGSDGDSVTGPPGPAGPAGPSGVDGKDGAAGIDGTNGRNGANAPTVTAADCADDGTLTFTFSDGTSITATGSCRASLLPVPAE